MSASECRIELTFFEKLNGLLTKRISPVDGKPVSDSSNCRMANGIARRVEIDGVQALANFINKLAPNQAYALGRIKDGHPDRVRVVRHDKLDGAGDPSVIARTLEYSSSKRVSPVQPF